MDTSFSYCTSVPRNHWCNRVVVAEVAYNSRVVAGEQELLVKGLTGKGTIKRKNLWLRILYLDCTAEYLSLVFQKVLDG
jgi:hypothetical protein